MAKSAAASMGAISDPILMLLSCSRLKGPSVSMSNPCLGLETHGGDEVRCGGHFHVPSRCKIGVPAILPLSIGRPSPIPILVWKHDEPHFHVERTWTDGRAREQTVVWRPNLVPKLAPRLSASTPPPRSPAVRSNFPSEHSHSTTTTLNNEGCKGSGEMRDETTAWHGMACTDREPSFLLPLALLTRSLLPGFRVK